MMTFKNLDRTVRICLTCLSKMKNLKTSSSSFFVLACSGVRSIDMSGGAKTKSVFYSCRPMAISSGGYMGNLDVLPQSWQTAAEKFIFENARTVMVSGTLACSFLKGTISVNSGIFYNDKTLDPEAVTLGKIYKARRFHQEYIANGKSHGNKAGRKILLVERQPVLLSEDKAIWHWKVPWGYPWL